MFSPLIPWSCSIGGSCPSGLIIQMLNLKKWSFNFLIFSLLFCSLLCSTSWDIFSTLFTNFPYSIDPLCLFSLILYFWGDIFTHLLYFTKSAFTINIKDFFPRALTWLLDYSLSCMLFCFCVVIISQFFLSILKIHFKKSIFWIFCFLFVYVWLSCCWVFSYSWWFMIDIPI